MSHFLDRLKFFTKPKETFSNGHGAVVESATYPHTKRYMAMTGAVAP